MATMTEIRHHGGMIRGERGPRARYGADYEEFISRLCIDSIRHGAADRRALRTQGWSDEDIDQGVAELMARGFLLETDEPDTWSVVPPRESFPQYLHTVEHRAALTRATIAELDNEWRRAVGRDTRAALPDLDILASVPEITERIVTMHQTARERLWWAMDASAATQELLARLGQDERLLALAESVDVRLVLDTSLLEVPGAVELMERSAAAGHGVRVGNGVPFGVLASDDDSVLVDISSYDLTGYGSLALRRLPARQAVIALLEEIWSLSTPFGPIASMPEGADGTPVVPLDERDRRVLSLLSTGASDQIIARQTGVSVRTVERRVRYLMEHLGAATRFQAGVQAVRRGWV